MRYRIYSGSGKGCILSREKNDPFCITGKRSIVNSVSEKRAYYMSGEKGIFCVRENNTFCVGVKWHIIVRRKAIICKILSYFSEVYYLYPFNYNDITNSNLNYWLQRKGHILYQEKSPYSVLGERGIFCQEKRHILCQRKRKHFMLRIKWYIMCQGKRSYSVSGKNGIFCVKDKGCILCWGKVLGTSPFYVRGNDLSISDEKSKGSILW